MHGYRRRFAEMFPAAFVAGGVARLFIDVGIRSPGWLQAWRATLSAWESGEAPKYDLLLHEGSVVGTPARAQWEWDQTAQQLFERLPLGGYSLLPQTNVEDFCAVSHSLLHHMETQFSQKGAAGLFGRVLMEMPLLDPDWMRYWRVQFDQWEQAGAMSPEARAAGGWEQWSTSLMDGLPIEGVTDATE